MLSPNNKYSYVEFHRDFNKVTQFLSLKFSWLLLEFHIETKQCTIQVFSSYLGSIFEELVKFKLNFELIWLSVEDAVEIKSFNTLNNFINNLKHEFS